MSEIEFEPDGLLVDVRPSWRRPRCSECGRRCGSYDTQTRGRLWRHLDLGGMMCHLRYSIRRANCRRCGIHVEHVPWADPGSLFTRAFEDQVGYLAQHVSKTAVCQLMRVNWRTVGDIARRVVDRYGPEDPLGDLVNIGVDELSVRRRHKYITVVTDHDRGCLVWAAEGKTSDVLAKFFDKLGAERCAQIRIVTLDMSAAYAKAVTDACPQATQVLDRFHVQRLIHDALDKVRRAEVREAETPEEKRAVKKTRWPLQKNPWNLQDYEREKLSLLQRANKKLFRAYLLKEALLRVLDRRQVNVARRKLDEWLAWASRSRIKPFVRLARTIRKHAGGILAYVRTGMSNGPTEALNGKIRTITRRSYGFHSAAALIALIRLCCCGIYLQPVHVYPALSV